MAAAPPAIRRAVLTDLPAIVDLHALLVSNERREGYDPDADPRWSRSIEARRYFEKRVSGDEGIALVAVHEAMVVGYLLGGPRPGASPAVGLESVFVAPASRRLGAATALVRAFLEWCDASSLRPITVAVAPANAGAVRLYEALGFAPRTLILERRG
ncbi:MAG: GNAT family N-acetyltransferase [Deltaproteobacteria bacterium]|nr:GNAT family N-acetyltransferase [Deltaproteobacteria bacterium]